MQDLISLADLTTDEILGLRLLSLHNLHFYAHLMDKIREAIGKGTFAELKESIRKDWYWGPDPGN